MASNKQKIIAPKQPSRKPVQTRKLQAAISAPEPTPARIKLKLKLKPKPNAQKTELPPVSPYQFPLSAPHADDAPGTEKAEENERSKLIEQGFRRGIRQRSKPQAPDMVFGSEMENLASSATMGKTENKNDARLCSPSCKC